MNEYVISLVYSCPSRPSSSSLISQNRLSFLVFFFHNSLPPKASSSNPKEVDESIAALVDQIENKLSGRLSSLQSQMESNQNAVKYKLY